MKYSVDLMVKSSDAWIAAVKNDFDSFLQDHADCERKASAMAMSFVAKYPDRNEIIPELIETAIEELEHFQQVFDIMKSRGVSLAKEMTKDLYIQKLMALSHGGTPETRFRDRLLLASIIECRGCERFKLVSENLEDEELSKFYKVLWTSEAKHGNIFVKMALNYFEETSVYNRLDELIEKEAEVLNSLEIRSALH
ncbi:tRNA-(ms[2]io[6]A)-hydroxylase [Flexithrix dorotheae]|uniref:tRNA-(ms[2]io[6]A)-hydroxylase n=1 Tax=Flexithrix dorotheae TaxID=70993 RepID=UPI00035ED789|nr:tRNA-(ms[2]io[6]A)-hydroxylase [Flexithrix dorotheae]